MLLSNRVQVGHFYSLGGNTSWKRTIQLYYSLGIFFACVLGFFSLPKKIVCRKILKFDLKKEKASFFCQKVSKIIMSKVHMYI